jgi:phage shock protein C
MVNGPMFKGSTAARYRLHRDTERGIVAGVCAGIADYFDLEPIIVRLGFIAALVMFFPPTILAYIILAVALRPRPRALYGSPEDEAFWRSVATAPDDTVRQLTRRFATIEDRLRRMESQVTSSDFDLHRKFRDLGR